MLRISLVDFLNARPLTWGLLKNPPSGISITRDLPSVCADKLASGQTDVGLIPTIEYQRISGLRIVPGLGIAASSEVRSVLLVSDVSREKIRSVSLDPASRTSAVLVKVLLKRLYGLEPEYRNSELGTRNSIDPARPASRVPHPGAADAALIIGDPALKTRLNGHVVLDLAAEWRAWSGHPFVFAFWAVAPSVSPGSLTEVLRASYEAGRRDLTGLAREEAEASGLSAAVIEDYLRHSLHYELDGGDLAGLELFFELAAEQGLIPGRRPLEFL